MICAPVWAATTLKGAWFSHFPTYTFFFQQEGVKTENNDHINLKVAGQNGSVVQFKIKRHTPLRELIMKAYCKQQVSNWYVQFNLIHFKKQFP